MTSTYFEVYSMNESFRNRDKFSSVLVSYNCNDA